MGLFTRREANHAERQVWALTQASAELLYLGRRQVETYIGRTTTEYDALEQSVFAAAADFNRAYAAKEWRTLGNQHDEFSAAVDELNSYMEDNNYGPQIEAAKMIENGAVA